MEIGEVRLKKPLTNPQLRESMRGLTIYPIKDFNSSDLTLASSSG